MLQKNTAPQIPIHMTSNIFFQFIPAYKAIVIHVSHKTKALQRSGIKQNINKNIILITINDSSNCLSLFIDFCFLISHPAVKSTYHNLKNSQG